MAASGQIQLTVVMSRRAAALMSAVGLAAWKLTGLYLLAICATGPVMAALRYI